MLDLLQNVNDFFSDISGTVYSITHAFGQIRTFIDTAQTCFNDMSTALPGWFSSLFGTCLTVGIITKIFHWG